MRRYIILLLPIFFGNLVTSLTGEWGFCHAQNYENVRKQWLDSLYVATADILRDSIIRQDGDSMKLWWTVYGEKPADGRSLWISLHGGGGTTPEINDQQWRNQKFLYRPTEGVYVAPRSPLEAWDMWCQQPIDSMYRVLIRTMIAHYDVNPDKVYLLGYSAGGDGVWRMAPRMADHWAAASMMAGHPGDVHLENLLNTPFMIWCGAEDAAYNRNQLDRERGLQMDSLQRTCPNGYIHETHIMEGKGHWMDREDAAALPWMAQYRRQAWPKHIIWQQEAVLRPTFYWLSAPRQELKRGKRVDAVVQKNTVNISRCDYSELTLYLSDELVDLKKPVTVKLRGKKVFKGRLKPSEETYSQTLNLRQDPRFAAPCQITVR